jgi:hypothetical protein
MSRTPSSIPNPKMVAAGRLNRLKRGPLTPEGLERLRQSALKNQPWLKATGPKTPAGKKRSGQHNKLRRKGSIPIRQIYAELTGISGLTADMDALRTIALANKPAECTESPDD